MPKNPVDYSNTSFYRIVCKDPTIKDCYVGSTTNLIKRRCSHKDRCNHPKSKKYHLKVYQFIRENGGWENWELIEIEKKSCSNINEALRQERYWLEHYGANLNIVIPTRTSIEYTKDNTEKRAEYSKLYREENKEKVAEDKKRYYEENKEKVLEYQKRYSKENKEKVAERKKMYFQNNREKLTEYYKTYNQENKDLLKEKKSTPYNCICGSIIKLGNKAGHFKTSKHKSYVDGLA